MTASGSCSSGICLEREYLFCASKHGQVELGVVAKKAGRRGKFHTLLEPSYLLRKPRFHLKLCNRMCGTGEVKNDSLIDEGLHLISACQLAGFRHVIGTLWVVRDGKG